MKLLHMPNEVNEADLMARQVGPRKAFEALRKSGNLTELLTISYLSRIRELGSVSAFEKASLIEIKHFQPDIAFVQHICGSNLRASYWAQLKEVSPRTTIVYHDEDPYDSNVKIFDFAMRGILIYADLVLISGSGQLFDLYRNATTAIIRYINHYYDNVRFSIVEPRKACDYQIVAIGNRFRSRVNPFGRLPGGRERLSLYRKLSQLYGPKFLLYGSGWKGLNSNRGALPFVDQEREIQRARISVNWDHFCDISYYCSDRLPISLAAGVPHVTSYHVGYENLFKGCRGLYWGKTVQEVIDCVAWLLCRSDNDLREEGLAARQWVAENLEANIVFKRAFEMCVEVHRERNLVR